MCRRGNTSEHTHTAAMLGAQPWPDSASAKDNKANTSVTKNTRGETHHHHLLDELWKTKRLCLPLSRLHMSRIVLKSSSFLRTHSLQRGAAGTVWSTTGNTNTTPTASSSQLKLTPHLACSSGSSQSFATSSGSRKKRSSRKGKSPNVKQQQATLPQLTMMQGEDNSSHHAEDDTSKGKVEATEREMTKEQKEQIEEDLEKVS